MSNKKTFDEKLDYHQRIRAIIYRLEEKNTSIDDLALLYADMLCDVVDEEAMVKEAASKHLNDFQLEGDSYGVPSVVDIVESLVRRLDLYKLLEGRASDVTVYDWSDNDKDAVKTIEQLRDVLERLEK